MTFVSNDDRRLPDGTDLSERLRPNSEAAPWVVEAVKDLERELEECKRILRLERDRNDRRFRLNALANELHSESRLAGWWSDVIELREALQPETYYRALGHLVATKIALVHSEVSEALEGYRKGAKDDHLPSRPAVEVELADAIIRILDLAGYLGLDLEGAIQEKREYNRQRADHKPEARAAAGGKRF